MRLVQYILIGCSCVGMYAQEVVVKNDYDQSRYAAIYNYNRVTGNAERLTEVVEIGAGKQQAISYPRLKWYKRVSHTQVLLHDDVADEFAQQLSYDRVKKLKSASIDGEKKVTISAARTRYAVADSIEVANMTEQPWFIAMYVIPHASGASAERYTQVLRVDPQASVTLQRPDIGIQQRLTHDRKILFHENKDALAEKLSYQEHRKIPYIQAGAASGSTFFIAQDVDGATRGYNAFSWKTRDIAQAARQHLESVYEAVTNPYVRKVREKYLSSDVNPWVDQTAEVRTGNEMEKNESRILQERDTQVRQAVSKLLGRSLSDEEPTPRIALVCSGGGYRAMFATLGTMRGAYHHNVWDALSYLVGLSGSTWAISPYMMSSESVPDFVERAIGRGTQGLSRLYRNIAQARELLREQLLRRIGFQQTLSLIDPYGFLLGQALLKDTYKKDGTYLEQHAMTLAQQKREVENGQNPFPIYTAIIGQTSSVKDRAAYSWIFFTPYEVGSQEFGGYVPSWGFGRKYNKGQSVNKAIPYNLGYCMGIWGSAFTASLQDAYEMMLKDIKIPLVQELFKGLANTKLGNQRMLPARVPNMTYNMSGAPLKQYRYISLLDGGYASNVPLPAVVSPERSADVVIMLDVSGDIASSSKLEELKVAREYAQRRGVPMPEIDYEKAYNSVASVFTRNDKNSPALVYMPMIKNENAETDLDPRAVIQKGGFLKTSNFSYTREDAESFVNLCERNMQDAVPQIKTAIEHVLQQRTQ